MSKELDKKRCGANVEKVFIDEFVPSKELEILKLRDMLDEAHIPYYFNHINEYGGYKDKPAYQIIIYDDKVKHRLCDVIYHVGSYGFEQNKLEIMGALTYEENEDDSVLGYLTADEVFKRFKYCYEHNTDIYVKEDK